MNILGTTLAALLNSLWQSAALALLVWAALRFLPRLNVQINAATRCAVWWAVLAAVVFLPIAPQPGSRFVAPPPASSLSESEALPVPVSAVPVTLTEIEAPAPPPRAAAPVHITAGTGLLAIFAIWSALFLLRICQLVRSYRYLRGIKQRSRAVSPEQSVNFNYWLLACSVDRTALLLVSSEIASPMAVGFRRPAVIVPETLLNEFTPEELDHVLLHELAHIARYDDWTNLFARLIGALLPLHPVAIWLLRRIEQEREVACDDWVVAMTGEARPYAASLTRLFELCSARRRQLLATGMADRASHLGQRIEALLRAGRDFAPRVSLVRVALGAAILFGLVVAGAHAPHWVAFAQEPVVPPLPTVAPTAPVPPVAPAAPVPEVAAVPAVAPEPPEAPERFAFEGRQRALQTTLEFLRRELEERRRTYSPDHPDMVRLAQQVRMAEAAMQAQKAQMLAMQATQRAQIEQERAAEQSQASAAGGSFLAALVAAGYGDLPVDAIIELRNSGISAEFLRSVADAGWGKLSVKELLDLAHSGVSPQYLRGLHDAGFKNLTVPEAIEIALNGIRPELMRALKDAFPQITMLQIIEAAHSGLNSNDLRQAREYGPNLTFEQIIRLKHAGVI